MTARPGRRRPWLPAALVTALLALAACGGADEGPLAGEGSPTPPQPLAGCTELTGPPPDAAAAPGRAASAAGPVPDLTLPCFADGEPVSLPDVPGPAIVNLWASWCGPCRDELPVLQRYAEEHAAQVHVLGVVTADSRTRAGWFAHDAGVGFPALFDPDDQLRTALNVWLPATLFISDGEVRYLHQGQLDDDDLARHAHEQLGVVP